MWNVWLGLGLIRGGGATDKQRDTIQRIWGDAKRARRNALLVQAQREDQEVVRMLTAFLSGSIR